MNAKLKKKNSQPSDILLTPPSAPDSSHTSSLLVLDRPPPVSSLASMQRKDQWTVTLRIAKVKTVLNIGESKSHVHRRDQS